MKCVCLSALLMTVDSTYDFRLDWKPSDAAPPSASYAYVSICRPMKSGVGAAS